jgi:hypothetical protein
VLAAAASLAAKHGSKSSFHISVISCAKQQHTVLLVQTHQAQQQQQHTAA